jgi:hypothetical protein
MKTHNNRIPLVTLALGALALGLSIIQTAQADSWPIHRLNYDPTQAGLERFGQCRGGGVNSVIRGGLVP